MPSVEAAPPPVERDTSTKSSQRKRRQHSDIPPNSVAPESEKCSSAAYRMFCKCGSSARVPFTERWTMDPLRRWYHYNIFPRTMLLHFALIATVTAQIVLINGTTAQYSQNLHNSWVSWLFPPNYVQNLAGNPLSFPGDEYFTYRTEEFNTSTRTLFENYFDMATPNTVVPDIINVYAGPESTDSINAPIISFTTAVPLELFMERLEAAREGGEELYSLLRAASAAEPEPDNTPFRQRRGKGANRHQQLRDSCGNVRALHAVEVHCEVPVAPVVEQNAVKRDAVGSLQPVHTASSDSEYAATYYIHDIADYEEWASIFVATPGQLAYFVQNVLKFEVQVQMRTYNTATSSLSSGVCLLWDVIVEYVMAPKGVVLVQLNDVFNTCHQGWTSPSPLMFLAASIILLALLQQLSITRTFLKNWRIIQWSLVLLQTSRYHAREAKKKRRLATANRQMRLEAAILAVEMRKSKLELAQNASRAAHVTGTSPNAASAGIARIDHRPKFHTFDEAVAAKAVRTPHVHYPCDTGILRKGAWPLISAALGWDKPVHMHYSVRARHYDHLRGDDDGISHSSCSSSSSSDSDGKSLSSCSCSSSEFSVSSDSDVEDPNMVLLGLRPAQNARRRASSSSSSSSSSRTADVFGTDDEQGSSESSIRKRPLFRSLAQEAAYATRNRTDRRRPGLRRRKRNMSVETNFVGSESSSSPSSARRRRSSTASYVQQQKRGVTVEMTTHHTASAEVMPVTTAHEDAQRHMHAGTQNRRSSPTDDSKIKDYEIDWGQPDLVPRDGARRDARHPIFAAVHRLRHAAHHLRPDHLLSLIDPWFFLSTVANIFNIVYAIMSLVLGEASVPGPGRLLLGLAAALDWMTITQYLKYNGNYYLMVRTLRTSSPAILRNIVGALPIYFVYVVMGTLIFGSVTERFDGLSWSAITLFAVANGDVVRETFQMSLYGQIGWFYSALAQVIMYFFCFMFIYTILKTTTAINEQSYMLVRPIPKDFRPGARAEDVPDALGKADVSPLAYRLPLQLRRFFIALQGLRDAGAGVGSIVRSAEASMPEHETSWLTGFIRCCKSQRVASQAKADSGASHPGKRHASSKGRPLNRGRSHSLSGLENGTAALLT